MRRSRLLALIAFAASPLCVGSAGAERITILDLGDGVHRSSPHPIASPVSSTYLSGVLGASLSRGDASGLDAPVGDRIATRGLRSTLRDAASLDVAVDDPASVGGRPMPEPGALTLFLAGFGVIGALVRRAASAARA